MTGSRPPLRQPRPFVDGAEIQTEPSMNRPGFKRTYLVDQQDRDWQEMEQFAEMNLEKMRLADEKKYGEGKNSSRPTRTFEPPPLDDLGPDESVSNVGPTGHSIWTGLEFLIVQ